MLFKEKYPIRFFKEEGFKNVKASEQCKDLLLKLVCEQENRLSTLEALQHPWI